MGIVLRQSIKNTIIIYLGFLIGGVNTIVLYSRFLKAEYYGLAMYVFSASNLLMPIMALGIQFTIIKFFVAYKTKQEKDSFLSSVLFLPLLIALPIGFCWDIFHNLIMGYIAKSNVEGNLIIENYTIYIYIIAVCCAYFEVFYSWAKVQMQSVFGNILKELYNRVAIMLLLFAVNFDFITKQEFLYYMALAYIIRTLLMLIYAFKLYTPKLSFGLPANFKEVLRYTFYIVLAGSAGAIVLDIDKVMIPGKDGFATAAYYGVALFIGSFIEAPSRAMGQILQPLTSKSINENNDKETNSLYHKSAINLLLVGGLFFILVNCNVDELFKIMPNKNYAVGGGLVVLLISGAKLFMMSLGNNGAIIQNSKFYRITMPIGVGMAFMVYYLNIFFYNDIGMGTEGLALATLLTVLIFNAFKLWFVRHKLNMFPYTLKTLQMVFIILGVFLAFYFWNFSVPEFSVKNFRIDPLINIILKSILIIPAYLFIVIKFSISDQINNLVRRFIKI
ncbi:lipopolysaccharide biosynthesis protein [Tenacibaculum finnmarkense]|uniref:lipopolysaccharide biosynthesis protein n=1 Tax=Tenacibaculum finnmarkense TaxID=2781243 RepID=UPI00187B8052|nr:oligosaccharide flippase family protein [Tenacibaculum finnmarkense]MBE7660847.1 oligosaccharide flippase family protein [Tenacibaculum finnmarkense genomovar finnmarkense]MCD8452816.1 oligosaccharide flippase family protein [Tenacibaculum finnmarkense genomovar ulcerans]MCG8252479.1 oligosaccharide flippase family protein [Tenacibaculum finnmarkense genomovar finnmarkense]MCG8804081.1 oligosaccharide flippase family protein [Tenacibaculum finnmarkense]MCG8814906.1 oligosaccharide flippase 